MSYDLYFYKRKSDELAEEEIKTYLNNSEHFIAGENGCQWIYQNEDTGVYFGIDWNEPNIDAEDIEFWDSFEEFDYLNFNFTINFIRPDYFGYEAFEILEKVIKDLNLYILNPQDEIDADIPQKFESVYLKNQWLNHNRKLILDNFTEFEVVYFSKEKSDFIWNYQVNKDEIQENLEDDIFVAGYILLKGNDERIYRVCVWPNHIPVIIPPVDYIIIQKEYKKFFKTIKESGLVSIKQIEARLGKYFEDFKHEIPNLKVVNQKNADKMKKEFNDLKIELQTKSLGSLLSFDGFVNHKP